MYDVMEGVKVIEVAEHTFVPAAGMILADWGADVIKIERTSGGGDPGRSIPIPGSSANGFSMFFEAGNRGKRSVRLDLTQAAGRDILYKMVAGADVFITNLRADARKKLGIEPDDLIKLNPKLIYARGTGYGIHGPMANDGGFDFPSSWCRSGSGYMQTQPDSFPPSQPGSVGDLGGGATLAGAISAALFRRERTGKGAIVDNALYLFGIYLMSQSMVAASLGMKRTAGPGPEQAGNPLVNLYRTKDGRWINLCLLNESWWADLCRHLGKDEWIDDPRYLNNKARFEHSAELNAAIQAVFGAEDYAVWLKRLATLQGVWAPLQSPEEVIADNQALANSFISEVKADDGRSYQAGVSPAQFDEAPIGELRASPEYGVHTEAVLRELGLGEAEMDVLRGSGVV
jgi:crotonobetainyl-CoA:carnitine CoA-transferase CaiB-like acyl-CoA transferase